MKLPSTMRECLIDGRGLPVPYVNVWSGEMPEETWILVFDSAVGKQGIAVPRGLRGVGVPDFTRAAPDRHRECILRRRCQICRRPGRWIVLSEEASTATVEFEGKKILVVTEPWLCEPCATFALRHCPALIRRRRAEDLILCRPEDFTLGYSSGWMEGPLEEHTKLHMPAMWGEIHLRSAITQNGRRILPVLP